MTPSPATTKGSIPMLPHDDDPRPAAAAWPAWTENWFWSLSDPDERAALEPPALEPDDAPDARPGYGAQCWARLYPIAGGAPLERDGDRRDFEAGLAQVDAPYPPDDQAEDPMAFPRAMSPQERHQSAIE